MNENLPKSTINWDKFAEALKDKFAQEMVDEKDGQEDPYNWFLEDVTVSDIVDFVKNYFTTPVELPKNRYTEKIPKSEYRFLKTVEVWEDYEDNGGIVDEDGFGYWVKDGYASRDDVFSTPKLDATHVIWHNK